MFQSQNYRNVSFVVDLVIVLVPLVVLTLTDSKNTNKTFANDKICHWNILKIIIVHAFKSFNDKTIPWNKFQLSQLLRKLGIRLEFPFCWILFQISVKFIEKKSSQINKIHVLAAHPIFYFLFSLLANGLVPFVNEFYLLHYLFINILKLAENDTKRHLISKSR